MVRSVRSLRLLGPSFHSVNSLLMIVRLLLRLLREVFLVSLVMRRLQRVPIGIIVLIIDFLILEKIFFVGAFVLLIVLQIENKTEYFYVQKNSYPKSPKFVHLSF